MSRNELTAGNGSELIELMGGGVGSGGNARMDNRFIY